MNFLGNIFTQHPDVLMVLAKAGIPGHSRGEQYIDRPKGTEVTETYLNFRVLFQK